MIMKKQKNIFILSKLLNLKNNNKSYYLMNQNYIFRIIIFKIVKNLFYSYTLIKYYFYHGDYLFAKVSLIT